MEEISLEDLGKEFQILWQNIDDLKRHNLRIIMAKYFGETERLDKIINKLQEKIE